MRIVTTAAIALAPVAVGVAVALDFYYFSCRSVSVAATSFGQRSSSAVGDDLSGSGETEEPQGCVSSELQTRIYTALAAALVAYLGGWVCALCTFAGKKSANGDDGQRSSPTGTAIGDANLDDFRVLTLAVSHDMVIQGVGKILARRRRARRGCVSRILCCCCCCGGGGGDGAGASSNGNSATGIGCCGATSSQVISGRDGNTAHTQVSGGCCTTRARQIVTAGGVVAIDGVLYSRDPTRALSVAIPGGVTGPVPAYAVSELTVGGGVQDVYATSGNVRCGTVGRDVHVRSGKLVCGPIGGNANTRRGNIDCDGCVHGAAEARHGNVSAQLRCATCV